MRLFMIFLVSTFVSCMLAQTPDNVKKAFAEKYPNIETVSWGTDRNAFHEAHFTLDGKKHRADFSVDGKWVETEISIKWDDLPQAVKDAFKEEDKKKDIVEIEMVDSNEKGVFYDLEFKTGGGKLDITIRPDGTVMGTDNH